MKRIHRLLLLLRTGYGLGVFSLLFILFFPVLLVPIAFPRYFRVTGIVNRWWAKGLFTLCFVPYHVEMRFQPRAGKTYVFCANHFSYLDIPTMGLNPHDTIFVGKSGFDHIPLFGFMYRRLHITVDRDSLKSRFNSLKQSLQALREGKSLAIFPEGGILSTHPPQMIRFKDGAFRAAIETQTPIVPVTIPHNWKLLPDGEFLLLPGRVLVIFHEPLETTGLTLDDVDDLKKRTYCIIEEELKRHA